MKLCNHAIFHRSQPRVWDRGSDNDYFPLLKVMIKKREKLPHASLFPLNYINICEDEHISRAHLFSDYVIFFAPNTKTDLLTKGSS